MKGPSEAGVDELLYNGLYTFQERVSLVCSGKVLLKVNQKHSLHSQVLQLELNVRSSCFFRHATTYHLLSSR
jgi:hypothetical protein